ncbi:hypothetical protein WJX72_008673 [[Myrmecia] bisecta]|uniref:Uncharacterized protein n=1 Tax=[Myrmecia] bisecta TaxID=41462 RepID=A0AAW1PQG0_9CHLO
MGQALAVAILFCLAAFWAFPIAAQTDLLSCDAFISKMVAFPTLSPLYRESALQSGCADPSGSRRPSMARHRSVLEVTPIVEGSMQAVAVGGNGADTRRAFVAEDEGSSNRYVVAQVEGGTFQLGTSSSSLTVSAGITSIIVLKMRSGNVAQTDWFVNLQQGVTQRQWFNLNSVAVQPSSGNLLLAGEFAGSLTLDSLSLTAQGSFDAFAAEVAQDTGKVVWAQRYGGLGRDAAQDISVSPEGQAFLVGSTTKEQDANSTTEHPQTIFVAQLAAQGSTVWWTGIPADAAYFNNMKVRAGTADVDIAVSVNGPATVTVANSLINIPQNQAAIVVYRVSTSGQIALNKPLVISAASNSYAMLNLGDMIKTTSNTFVAAGFSGQLMVNETDVAQTPDTYGDGVVVMAQQDLSPACTGSRPFFISFLALPPSDALTTTKGTLVRSSASSLGAGAISGIVIGGIILLVLLALAVYLVIRRLGYCGAKQKPVETPSFTNNPAYKNNGPPGPTTVSGQQVIPVTAQV